VTFNAEINSALAAKLDQSVVKQRKQSGFSLSYIEGWYAIDQANKIFGHDQWTMEFDYIKDVYCQLVDDGQKGKRWHVSYIAQCRVNVMGVIRVDVGSGHGIDRECGIAHESASKEAATDAMKRAFRTFGNPFGLALYDKKQEMVASNATELLVSDAMLFEKTILENVKTGRLNDLAVRTICKLAGGDRPALIPESRRASVLQTIADDNKIKFLNQGMNSKGEVIVEDVRPTKSLEELKAKAAELMPASERPEAK
jgi:DNA recombination protein Rad52